MISNHYLQYTEGESGKRNFNNESGRNCCLAWLRERRSGWLLSSPTAGPFVAEEADARQAGPRAVSAHVGQVWVFWWWKQLELSSSVVCL